MKTSKKTNGTQAGKHRINTDPLRDVPIIDIVKPHVNTLKKNGSTFVGLCPFHQEKTPSFTVFEKSNTYHCFGCGESGDGIQFRIKHLGESFPEACKQIAKDYGISMDSFDIQKYEEKQKKHAGQYAALTWAQKFFAAQLQSPGGEEAKQYAKKRFDDQTIKLWGIGYAPNTWGSLIKAADAAGFDNETLLQVGLISEKNDQLFDYFRGRLIFPLKDKTGRVIGFTGRNISDNDKSPKYLNTPTTELFNKSESFFGFDLAHYQIRKQNEVVVTEGPADVIRLHQAGALNTVASNGTSLSDIHINIVQSLADHVTLVYDGDEAGQKAVIANGQKLAKAGLSVFVVDMPEGQDADSHFTGKAWADEIDKRSDFLNWYAMKEASNSASEKALIVSFICDLLLSYPESSRELRINDLSKIIKPKKVWHDKLKEIKIEREAKGKGIEDIPRSVNITDFEKYGFYEENDQLYFQTKYGIQRGANFTLAPLFHVESTRGDAKRLFTIKNQFGVERIIKLAQRELISLPAFKLHVESLGNFIWELGEIELNRFKRFLYEKTKTCVEIKQLGWQKEGFFAWSNGIYDGKNFIEINRMGIVEHKGQNFFLPALSSIDADDPKVYQSERLQVHKASDITSLDVFKGIQDVFGDNGIISLGFLFATLFRDIVYRSANFFPLLNMFGPKNTGKTALALTLVKFFGAKQGKGINLPSASKPSISDSIEKTSNCICHLDEYKNTIDPEKIEILKSVHDGVGRTRMNMEKDKKMETTAVDCGVVLSGQEAPTADIALFSRVMYLEFSKNTYRQQEQTNFKNLETLMESSATGIVHDILQHREYFEAEFANTWEQVIVELHDELGDNIIESRILRNWSIAITAYRLISKKIQVPVTDAEYFGKAKDLISLQNTKIKKSDEVGAFWDIVKYLVREKVLNEGCDFVIHDKIEETFKEKSLEVSEKGYKILYLNPARCFHKYAEYGSRAKTTTLPLPSLRFYLEKSKEYLGLKESKKFKKGTYDDTGKQESYVTKALCFNFSMLKEAYDFDLSDGISEDDEGENNTELPF